MESPQKRGALLRSRYEVDGSTSPFSSPLASPSPPATRTWARPARISIGTTQHGTTTTLEHHIDVIDDLVSKGARRSACGSAPAAEHSRCIPRVPAPCLHRVLRNLAAASRPRLPSARRSIRFCRPCLPLSVAPHSSSAGEEVILLAGNHTLAGWQPVKKLPISKPS